MTDTTDYYTPETQKNYNVKFKLRCSSVVINNDLDPAKKTIDFHVHAVPFENGVPQPSKARPCGKLSYSAMTIIATSATTRDPVIQAIITQSVAGISESIAAIFCKLLEAAIRDKKIVVPTA
jgi:hypothetical protein